MLLPKALSYFKMNTAKRINQLRRAEGVPVWQRNYYEHIVRNDEDLDRVRQYILANPLRWDTDEHNPIRTVERVSNGATPRAVPELPLR
jgi:hypothetical protein